MLVTRIYRALAPADMPHLFDLDFMSALERLRDCDNAIQIFLLNTAKLGDGIYTNHNFDQIRLLAIRIKKVTQLELLDCAKWTI